MDSVLNEPHAPFDDLVHMPFSVCEYQLEDQIVDHHQQQQLLVDSFSPSLPHDPPTSILGSFDSAVLPENPLSLVHPSRKRERPRDSNSNEILNVDVIDSNQPHAFEPQQKRRNIEPHSESDDGTGMIQLVGIVDLYDQLPTSSDANAETKSGQRWRDDELISLRIGGCSIQSQCVTFIGTDEQKLPPNLPEHVMVVQLPTSSSQTMLQLPAELDGSVPFQLLKRDRHDFGARNGRQHTFRVSPWTLNLDDGSTVALSPKMVQRRGATPLGLRFVRAGRTPGIHVATHMNHKNNANNGPSHRASRPFEVVVTVDRSSTIARESVLHLQIGTQCYTVDLCHA
jgi:hypothetical protein